jgi:hypothetical protein
MAKKQVIKIGTKVKHYSFGGGVHEGAVQSIEKCADGSKYGRSINSMSMEKRSRNYVIELDNGHWCYGDQVISIVEG